MGESEDRKEIYQEAILKWGLHSQIKMAIEEMAELIVELCKLDRNVNGTSREKIQEELADVTICIEQIKWVYDESQIEAIERVKLLRLKNLMKGEAEKR